MHAPVLCSIPGWKVTTDELVSALGGFDTPWLVCILYQLEQHFLKYMSTLNINRYFLDKIIYMEENWNLKLVTILSSRTVPGPFLHYLTPLNQILSFGLRDGLRLETYIVNDLLSYTICLTIFAESAPYFVIKQQWKYQIQKFYRKYFKYFYKI